ncbi:MAG TPA: tetratricopeptide repeat protein, partial [Phototrophicaceae bacterium]|nr:tetratricopeptide repeat protein [Phototrophicaceae bacterium]
YYENALETARSVRATGAEGRALGHQADVYLNDDNAKYAVHLLREALPKLNVSGDLELSAYFVGRLGQALVQNGQEIEGRQLLERALRLAKQLEYRRYERHWSRIIGETALDEGRYEEALTHFEYALGLALDQVTAERLHLLCRSSRAYIALGKCEPAVQSARQALELAGQLADMTAAVEARGVLGAALLADKKPAEAIENLQAAATYYEHLPVDLSSITVLRSLGAAQAENGQLEAAIATYQQASQRAQKLASRLPLAQVYRDLGLLYSQQRDLTNAIKTWTAALAIYEAEKFSAQVARLHCDIAAARKYLGQGQRAIKDYEQALMAINDLKDDWETRGLVLSNAATAYVDQGDIESAEAFFNEAITLARRVNNEVAEATRRGNYGWFLLATGRPQQAIAALQYALQISKTLRLDLQAAIQTDNLGLAQDLLGNTQRALEYHQQALEMVLPLANPHWENIFRATQAATLTALNHVDEAAALLATVVAAGRTHTDIEVVVYGLTGQARIALVRGQLPLAGSLLDEALSFARRADLRRLQAEVLSLSSEYQAALGQPERAAGLWDEAQRLFILLHMPQAKTQPGWLHPRTLKPMA